MSKILIVAEHLDGQLNSSTARCVTCAKQIGTQAIEVLVLAADPAGIAAQAARIDGVSKVLCVAHARNDHALAAVYAPQIAAVAKNGYSHVLAPSTTFGKDVLPRAAALLGVAQVSDISSVEGPHLFKRPVYAGSAVVTVEAPAGEILVGTVRPASYPAAGTAASAAPIQNIPLDIALPDHTRFVELVHGKNDRPDLQSARCVVSGGRGLGSDEDFALIYALADKLGAAVGASRAAVDAGYVPSELQVGQTGKIIAPELYIAIGVSGAIQHLAGIKDAGTIVVINKDSEAPIFEVADFGLVGDLFTLVPELIAAIG
ncbi:MAG: FAD-binding protein [Rhodanobacter sp.]|jgi:electron transfer flavoprotein alpha subunit|nr:FAD-binding protein [Rhodanobacter sp.]